MFMWVGSVLPFPEIKYVWSKLGCVHQSATTLNAIQPMIIFLQCNLLLGNFYKKMLWLGFQTLQSQFNPHVMEPWTEQRPQEPKAPISCCQVPQDPFRCPFTMSRQVRTVFAAWNKPVQYHPGSFIVVNDQYTTHIKTRYWMFSNTWWAITWRDSCAISTVKWYTLLSISEYMCQAKHQWNFHVFFPIHVWTFYQFLQKYLFYLSILSI